MSDILLIGPRKLVTPLSFCGIDVAACDSGRAGCEMIEAAIHPVIFMTERLAAEMPEAIAAAEKKGQNVVLLPDHRGTTGFYKEKLEELIKKATGASKI
jgi:vacuolar-type H+-ATPase subunit F/Vma7